MTDKKWEHEWDDSQDIDSFTDIIDLNVQFVQIRVKCCKCGKLGVTDANVSWKPVYCE